MKNLLIGFASLVMVIAFSTSTSAQESFGSAGLEIAIPLGDFADGGANFGIGGSGTYEVGISDNFSVMAHAGVVFYATDDIETITGIDPNTLQPIIGTVDYSITQIPLQVGGRYYLSEQKEGLFVSALLGLHITSFSIEDESDSSSDFSFAPEVGYFLNESISVGLRYQIVSGENANSDYLGIRAAYNF